MTTTRARPLTNAERQRRYRARRAAEYRQAVAEGRTLLHTYCRELVGDPARVAWRADNGMTCRYRFDRAAWLVANGMTCKRCRFVEEYTMIRRRYRDIRNACACLPAGRLRAPVVNRARPQAAPRAVRVLGDSLENRAHTCSPGRRLRYVGKTLVLRRS